jgi:hypothetical protein
MVFVADRIHQELRRIVEFLNEQMRPAEVLAIEVAQFMAGSTRLLAPKLIGATERAAAVKAVTHAKPPIDEEGWLGTIREQRGEEAARNAGKLLSWFKERGFTTGVTDSGRNVRVPRPSGRQNHLALFHPSKLGKDRDCAAVPEERSSLRL